jgi:large subunit ribosomal protein L22
MSVAGAECRSVLTSIRVSPQKLNLVAAVIRGMEVQRALDYLRFCKKRVAKDVYKTLSSAVSNAENNHGMDVALLYVKESCVGNDFVLKRFHARARGRGAGVKKRFSRLLIKVAEKGA